MLNPEQLKNLINYGADLHGSRGVQFYPIDNRVIMRQSGEQVCVMTNLGAVGLRVTAGVNDAHPFNPGENVSLANSLVTIGGTANDSDIITYNGMIIHEMPIRAAL